MPRAVHAMAAVAHAASRESSHEEGGVREWSVATTSFTGDEQGNVKQLHGIRVGPPPKFEPIPGAEFTLDADLVLLAMGFRSGERRDDRAARSEARSRAATSLADANYMTSVPGVFAAGDMRRGQSLVVWAIAEGRKAAEGVHRYLISAESLVAGHA